MVDAPLSNLSNSSDGSGAIGESGPPANPQQQWPWWKIVLAVLFWPFILLWWIWRWSTWDLPVKIAATTAICLVVVVSYAFSVLAQRSPKATPSSSGSTSATSTAPTSTPTTSPAASNSQVLKWTYFGDVWPLTVPEVTVTCRGAGAVILAVNGKTYSVNGMAMTAYKDLPTVSEDGLWRDALSGGGPKVDLGPIIDAGLDLCKGKQYVPTTLATSTAMPSSTLRVPAAAKPSARCNSAFAAWEPKGADIDPTDPLVVATLTGCSGVAEWRGGLEAHPQALDYASASEIGPGNVRSDLLILCDAKRQSAVCADAVRLQILH